jgi:transcriptional regulator with XRE-family HTH domain
MEQAASEFLRALRGERSQLAFARRLGYRANPITDWERGARFPTAVEALRAAARANIDVPGAFRRFTPEVPLQVHGREYALDGWLLALRGGASVNDIAARSGLSRYSVSRWLRGQAKPRLPDFLRLVDAITGRLPHWVAAFVPIERVPSLAQRHREAEAARVLAFELPWTEAVLRLLETQAYRALPRHPAGWIAAVLGIAAEEEQRCLQALLEVGTLALEAGRYVVRAPSTVDTQGGSAALHRLKQHWCAVASGRLPAPAPGELFAYNVVSVSRADLELIREKLRMAFREIRSIVAASQPEQVAAVINLQLMAFDPGRGPAGPRHSAA